MTQHITLTPVEIDALRRSGRQATPTFAPRLEGLLEFELVAQPWFLRHRIIEVLSPAPFPSRRIHAAIGQGGDVRVLTGSDSNLGPVVSADPPPPFASPDAVRDYAFHCDLWTTTAELGELIIRSWADIPFYPKLDATETVLMDALQASISQDIRAPTVIAENGGHLVEKWVVAARALIRRDLHVGKDGAFRREDAIFEYALPVPPGKIWQLVNGRYVPVG